MKKLDSLGYIVAMAALAMAAVKSTNLPMGTAKIKYMYEKQYNIACAEYDKYYAENYEDILWEQSQNVQC